MPRATAMSAASCRLVAVAKPLVGIASAVTMSARRGAGPPR
jgi:hypothetical protein